MKMPDMIEQQSIDALTLEVRRMFLGAVAKELMRCGIRSESGESATDDLVKLHALLEQLPVNAIAVRR